MEFNRGGIDDQRNNIVGANSSLVPCVELYNGGMIRVNDRRPEQFGVQASGLASADQFIMSHMNGTKALGHQVQNRGAPISEKRIRPARVNNHQSGWLTGQTPNQYFENCSYQPGMNESDLLTPQIRNINQRKWHKDTHVHQPRVSTLHPGEVIGQAPKQVNANWSVLPQLNESTLGYRQALYQGRPINWDGEPRISQAYMNTNQHILLTGLVPNGASGNGNTIAQINGFASLNHQIPYQCVQNSWRDEPTIYHTRALVRSKIADMFFRLSQASVVGKAAVNNIVGQMEEILLMEAISKEEYVNQETLLHRIQNTIRCKMSQLVNRSSIQIANEAPIPVDRLVDDESNGLVKHGPASANDNSLCQNRSFDLPKYQEEGHDLQFQHQNTQCTGSRWIDDVSCQESINGALIANDNNQNSYILADLQNNLQKDLEQHEARTNSSQLHLDGELAANGRSAEYIDEATPERFMNNNDHADLHALSDVPSLQHFLKCQNDACSICDAYEKANSPPISNPGSDGPTCGIRRSYNDDCAAGRIGDTSEDVELTPKRQKIDHLPVSPLSNTDTCQVTDRPLFLQKVSEGHQHLGVPNRDPLSMLELFDSSEQENMVETTLNQGKTEVEVKTEADHAAGPVSKNSTDKDMHSMQLGFSDKMKELVSSTGNFSETEADYAVSSHQVKLDVNMVTSAGLMTSGNQDLVEIKVPVIQKAHDGEVLGPVLEESKLKGASLLQEFSPQQIKEHVASLRQWFGESTAKSNKKRAMADFTNNNACQLCAVEKLFFEPPYCTLCGIHFKHNVKYFTSMVDDAKYFFCTTCYKAAEGESITVSEFHIPKASLEKTRNCIENLEPWVYCSRCYRRQHQICALFNSKMDKEKTAEYVCPNCYVQELDQGEGVAMRQSAFLGSKDLPRTKLSDFIEERLATQLEQERQERANVAGKSFDEVPGAEDLVLRVVYSVDKRLQVKQSLLDVFQEGSYPKEFPYRSKVILLFQKIEGVEVCLFGMYVQEFGSECAHPNQRSIYISYLDSVKYFRPDIKTVSGETLRTFVYHQILVGYLDYCKKRGFSRCYIWSCPPTKADNYILYCHPQIQKTPKPDHLREWYHRVIRKSVSESIVSSVTNLYDHFFVPYDEHKLTASRLPYFDGDYWPRAAEDILKHLVGEDGARLRRKVKKPNCRRPQEATEHTDFSENSAKDVMLMEELGKTISKMKEDFIIVNLESTNMAGDTEDNDEIIERKIFGSREAFLGFCQTNKYQFDTLRRAKYSSMMLLYHLHSSGG